MVGQSILILGGGTAGVAAANVLRKLLPLRHQITLVDRQAYHVFKAGFPLVPVRHRRPNELIRPLDGLRQIGVEFIQAEVIAADLTHQIIHTSIGNLTYDYLVIALGAELSPESIPGFRDAAFNAYSLEHLSLLAAELPKFKKGRIVVFVSHLPYLGVGPYELVLLLQDYFHRKGRGNQVQVTFVTPETSPLPIAGPKFGRGILDLLERRGIGVSTQARILQLNTKSGHLILDGGIYIPGDMLIGIPSHQGPSPFRGTLLAQDGGWLEVNPLTLATRLPRVYAIGDAVGIRLPITSEWLPKLGAFAHYQGEVVARNIALEITGKEPTFRFTGKLAGISLITGPGKASPLFLKAYRSSGPSLKALPPSRLGYLSKVAFEKYWLHFWF